MRVPAVRYSFDGPKGIPTHTELRCFALEFRLVRTYRSHIHLSSGFCVLHLFKSSRLETATVPLAHVGVEANVCLCGYSAIVWLPRNEYFSDM